VSGYSLEGPCLECSGLGGEMLVEGIEERCSA
jgi:hypothetical protein